MPSKDLYTFKSTVFSIMLLVLASCGSKKSVLTKQSQSLRQDVVDYGKKYIHKPYRYAGKGPHSFDCSGYTSFVFKKFGYNLSASSAGQSRQAITIRRKEDLNVGDLVFFEGRRHNGRVGHVGIVTDIPKKGKFNFIHASTSSGVIISSSEEPYYKARYLRGGKIIKDTPNVEIRRSKVASTQLTNNDEQKTLNNPNTVIINADNVKATTEKESIIMTKEVTRHVKKEKENNNENKNKSKEDSKVRVAAIRRTDDSPVSPSSYITHEVGPGETLYSIAKKYKCTVEDLKKWNPEIINNKIYAGDKLKIY